MNHGLLSFATAAERDYEWFGVEGADRNMDTCPELRPCPKCGSVWTELSAVGINRPESFGRLKKHSIDLEHHHTVAVTVPGIYFEQIVAVRVECAEGHSYETNGVDFSPTPSWAEISVSWGPVYVLAETGPGRIRRPRRVR